MVDIALPPGVLVGFFSETIMTEALTMNKHKEVSMRNILISLALNFIFLAITAAHVAAHCEIPCGIYDDELRAKLIYEHSVTIEKSIKKIAELTKQNPANYNQLVRWISNKEDHATEIQYTISQYFMTQRIRPDAEKYPEKLSLLHKMLQAAMK